MMFHGDYATQPLFACVQFLFSSQGFGYMDSSRHSDKIQFSLHRTLDEIRDEENRHLIQCFVVVFLHRRHNLVPCLI